MRLLSSSELKYFRERLRVQYGVENAFEGYVLIRAGQGRIRATTSETLEVATRLRKVQQVGLYIAKLIKSDIVLS
ncbi:MAG: hypothetical protein J7K78_02350, partial [Thaumarchaeota archaeon]|nr:hypothetical protein [Nitrososphaerota archaeon]